VRTYCSQGHWLGLVSRLKVHNLRQFLYMCDETCNGISDKQASGVVGESLVGMIARPAACDDACGIKDREVF
jgi:hypothetical protein